MPRIFSTHTSDKISIKRISIPADVFGKPNTNPPAVVDQSNVTLYSFTVNTDSATYKFPIPSDYYRGDISFQVIWTNDGGTDDNGKTVKWQISYQTGTEGDTISGNHANSPKSIQDTYTSASGWIEHHADKMTIAAADFAGKTCIYISLSAITPTGTALTSEPHLMGICYIYTAIT